TTPLRKLASSSRSPASVSGRSRSVPSASCATRNPAASSKTISPNHALKMWACAQRLWLSTKAPAPAPTGLRGSGPLCYVAAFVCSGTGLRFTSGQDKGLLMPKWHRAERPTAIAPDGAEIRSLVDRAQGAMRLSVAEALVPPGQRTAKVYHQTIYEEIWYFLQ